MISRKPALIISGAFIILVPGAVLFLALLNLRKTDLLSWLVSAVTITASVLFGFRILRSGKKEEPPKKDKKQPRRRP